ncbi:MAG: dihydroorotase family protein [Candidatus Shapirobacteria bacterium]
MKEILEIPYGVDLHAHCRDFGQSHKETLKTAADAAAAGGVCFVGDMPNNSELTDSKEKILIKKEKVEGLKVDFGFYLGTLGDEKQNFKECYDEVLGLKVYMSETTGGFTVTDKDKLDHIFKSWDCEKPILVHSEDNTLKTAIELAEKYDRILYVCHVSLKSEIDLIKNAKDKRPGKVFAEVTPHHLFLDSSQSGNPFKQMKPPLVDEYNQRALWIAINDGTIDTIGSDHAPHTIEEKTSANPPFGVPGLETTLQLLLKAERYKMIRRKKIIELTHSNPIKIFGIKEEENSFVEIDQSSSMILRGKNLETKCKWTPFEGMKMQDIIVRTTKNGEIIYNNKNL